MALEPIRLKDLHQIAKPAKREELIAIRSWLQLIDQIFDMAQAGDDGALFVHGESGHGKSTFLRLLAWELEQRNIAIMRGVVVEPITQTGWIKDFLTVSVSGSQGSNFSLKDLLSRLGDLPNEAAAVILAIDGLELVQPSLAFAELSTLLNLAKATGIRLLVVACLDHAHVQDLLRLSKHRDFALLTHELPLIDTVEQRRIVSDRLKRAGIDLGTVEKVLENVIVPEAVSIGAILQNCINFLQNPLRSPTAEENLKPSKRKTPKPRASINRDAEKVSTITSSSKTMPKTSEPPVDRGKNKLRSPDLVKEPRSFDDFLKPMSKK